MKALMLNGRVCDVVGDDSVFPVHENLTWLDCADDVTTSHHWDGSVFTAPPVAPEEIARHISSALLWDTIPLEEQRAITRYLNTAIADDQHADHEIALDYQGIWTSQSHMNILSPAWISAVEWLLARALIGQATHDALLA